MRASRLAAGAIVGVLALAAAGCGSDEKFTAVSQPAATPTTTATSPSAAVGEPAGSDPLAGLGTRQKQALAGLVAAQTALAQRGDAVVNAGTQADKVVQRIASGYNAPSGSSTPEVRRLAEALNAFGLALAPIATEPSLLPQLSTELGQRYTELTKKRPAAAARLLNAKQQVDAVVAQLPGLQQQVQSAASKARAQEARDRLDAQALNDVIESGSQSATSALNGVNQAFDTGVRALAATA